MGKRNATRMAPRVAVCAVAAAAVAYGGFCDESAEFSVEWRDEFEGDALNRSLWSVVCSNMSAPGCDDLPFITHARSNGAECRSALCVSDMVSVENGSLVLTSRRVGAPGNASNGWVTGAVKTRNKAAWNARDGTYRVCISAKLPGAGGGGRGQGLWPAHWLMPQDQSCDPDEGEMDVLEMVNGDGTVYSTYHWQDNWPNQSCAYPTGHRSFSANASLGGPDRFAEKFHEFAVERSTEYIAFAVDGKVLINSSSLEPSTDVLIWDRVPFYLILNSAIGGGWPGEPDERTASPAKHVVDYVRVARIRV